MAKRVYIYGLKLAFETVQKYVQKYAVQIKRNGGEGLYAAVDFVLALCIIVISIIDGNENAEGDWLSPLTTLSSGQINQVAAAYAKFQADVGITGGD